MIQCLGAAAQRVAEIGTKYIKTKMRLFDRMVSAANRKSKGSNAERELVQLFWKAGFAAVRVAGSGATSMPSPDLVVGRGQRKLAIEVKITKEEHKYIQKQEVEQLKLFSKRFGAEAWIAVRFFRTGWFFFSTDELVEKERSFFVSLELARKKGLLFEELVEAEQGKGAHLFGS